MEELLYSQEPIQNSLHLKPLLPIISTVEIRLKYLRNVELEQGTP